MSRDPNPDRLYELLPVIYRLRDAERDEPLRALLRVITEQVDLVEADVEQLYADWFVETCQDWVVPYIADLLGYRPVDRAAEAGGALTAEALGRIRATFPRRDVARTIASRRQRGTLAILERLAAGVAGWPARAVESYTLLDWAQSTAHVRPDRGRTADLRRGDALDRLDGPFDELAHNVSVGRINSGRTRRRYNIPSVGLFVWRLRPYSITRAPAYCVDRDNHRYTFSLLANDTPLVTLPLDEPAPNHIADELNVPAFIRRRAFDERTADYYGEGKSLAIWRDDPERPIPLRNVVPADLSDWAYNPRRDQVAVDPRLGRIAFAPRNAPRQGIWVSYQYAFSADMGGGEYDRPLGPTVGYELDDGRAAAARPDGPPTGRRLYRVGDPDRGRRPDRGGNFATIGEALARWWGHKPADAIVEIVDSDAYVEQIEIRLEGGQRLELRAANGARPTIRLLDWHTNRPDALRILRLPPAEAEPEAEADGDEDDLARAEAEPREGADQGYPAKAEPPAERGSPTAEAPPAPRVVLDGLLIAGRSVQLTGDLDEVAIRHCTLVPGWTIGPDCEPEHGTQPSLELLDCPASLSVRHSICGTIRVVADEVRADPSPILIEDSVLDATRPDQRALTGPEQRYAHARLTIRRSTVFGRVRVDSLALAENTIFTGSVRVVRRQVGCIRYCYCTPPPDSRTPRRHRCQPDLVLEAVEARYRAGELSDAERASTREREALRVRPRFSSARYGTPAYGQLAGSCAEEIYRGADDEGSMGAFHDLFEPQREANLRTRLDEYSPAGMEAGIVFVT